MSARLYYHDAYTTSFQAQVAERVAADGRQAVILDGTFFYPASGGQPADRGFIAGVPVVDVSIRAEDGAVIHWLQADLAAGDQVEAEIDWDRRFDHMQQHSGQHILSQAFIQLADAQTVSFHLSSDTVTIDLSADKLSQSDLARVELLANEIIWQNRPIRARMVSPDQVEKLPLRKKPPARSGKLRLIEIEDFDLTACGGTHVAHTGEIGIIKIIKTERRADHWRVEFRCGRRALEDYGRKNDIVNELTASLTTGQSDIVSAVGRLRQDLKQANRRLKRLQAELLQFEADNLLKRGAQLGDALVVSHVLTDADASQMRTLGSQLTQRGAVIALLGLAGPKSQLLFTRSADAPGEMNKVLPPALQILGPAARGGGSATFAQGGGPAADEERVAEALDRAIRFLSEKT